jgi:uncharacterized protein YukE
MGFQINANEMVNLGSDFRTISAEYRRLMPGKLACPRGGSDAIDGLLQTTLQVINEMHTVLYEAIDQHGIKLKDAASTFMRANANIEQEIQGIVKSFTNTTRQQAEEVVVQGYLATAVTGTAADAPVPQSIPSFFKGSLPKNLPTEAVTPSARPSVPMCSDTIISGDYPGLQLLASRLYWSVEQSNPLLDELSKRVKAFCAPYNNYGSTVNAFYASYSEDASIMSGFNKIIIMIANVIDKLAARLATCESMLETIIQKYQIPAALFVTGASTSDLMTRLRSIAAGASSPKQQAFAGLAEKIVTTANKYRDEAAAELDVLAEMIATGGLEYYTKRDLLPNSRDHGGILNSYQLGGDDGATAATQNLEDALAADGRALDYSSPDVKNAMNDLTLVSGKYAPMLGDLASGVKGVRDATDLLGRVQSVGSLAGTLTTDFEALAELAGAAIIAGG